jgi:hypothetical protein
MKVGDHVDVYINTGEKVGPGKITKIVSDNDSMVSNAHGAALMNSEHREVILHRSAQIDGNSTCPRLRVANSSWTKKRGRNLVVCPPLRSAP